MSFFFGNNEDVCRDHAIPDDVGDGKRRCLWCGDEIVGACEEYLEGEYHSECVIAAIERSL